jgi:hypothetical protein
VQRTLLPRIVFATLASAGVLLGAPATAATFKCEVKVNGMVILGVRATDRDNCYLQTSFGSENCAHYAPYLQPGVSLLEQIFNSTDRVNREYCKESVLTSTNVFSFPRPHSVLLQGRTARVRPCRRRRPALRRRCPAVPVAFQGCR